MTRSTILAAVIAAFAFITGCQQLKELRVAYPVGMGTAPIKQYDTEQKEENSGEESKQSEPQVEKPAEPASKPESKPAPQPAASVAPAEPVQTPSPALAQDKPAAPAKLAEPAAKPEAASATENTSPSMGEPAVLENNAMQKTYPATFDSAWQTVLDASLKMPLATVDKNSGIVVTDWMRNANAVIGFSGMGGSMVRYKFNVQVRKITADSTEITVYPFAQQMSGAMWKDASPAKALTLKLFGPIDAGMTGAK